MNQTRTILIAMILCTAAIVTAIVWPRYFPRYADVPGGAVDRWTGEECSSYLSDLVREDDPTAQEGCLFLHSDRRMLVRDFGEADWREAR